MAVTVKCDNCMYYDPSPTGLSCYLPDGSIGRMGTCRRSPALLNISPANWCGEFIPSKKACADGGYRGNWEAVLEWPR